MKKEKMKTTKMILSRPYSLSIILLLLAFNSVGQSNDTQRKGMSESYEVGSSPIIEISNKYGQVIVNTWDKNEVKVDVVVTAYGKSSSSTEKILDRVDFDFNQVNNYLILKTIFDRKSGLFKDLLTNIGDYGKSLLSKNKLDVDYEVFVPANSILKIENKFGDVYVSDLSNNCTLNISNGNLKAKNLSGNVHTAISFGNAFFSELNTGDLELKVADIEIEEANDLTISSSSSKILIYKAENARINSRNDKYQIKDINHIYGQSTFSKIEIDNINGKSDLEMSYGFLTIHSINHKFEKIQLKGKSTDFTLKFENGSYFNTSLTAKEDNLIIPKKLSNVDVGYTDEKEHIVSVKGTIGTKNSTPSLVLINAQKGDVKLSINSNK